MNPLQFYIGIGLPVVAVLCSLTVSLIQISSIREELRYGLQGVREDVREIRSDIKNITGKLADIDNRLSLIEDRWKIRP